MTRQLKNETVCFDDDTEPPRLFLLPSHFSIGSERRHHIFPLPRPNTGELSMFMETDSGDYLELAKYQMEHESWMVDDFVGKDRSVYMATPVDALFFALDLLYKHNDRFRPLKDFVEDCCMLEVIRSCRDHMQHIADVEECGEDWVYLYNESKCLAWLTKKVKAVAARLQLIGTPPPAACSSGASATSEDCVAAAHTIVAMYIPPALAALLKSSLGLDTRPATTLEEEEQKTPSLTQPKKQKSKQVQPPGGDNKGTPKNSVPKSAKTPGLTVKQKRLQKTANTGMKNISNYFTKK